MKVVVADTSPINYLILVDAIEILPRLYGRVTIPDVVLRELANEDASGGGRCLGRNTACMD